MLQSFCAGISLQIRALLPVFEASLVTEGFRVYAMSLVIWLVLDRGEVQAPVDWGGWSFLG